MSRLRPWDVFEESLLLPWLLFMLLLVLVIERKLRPVEVVR